MFGSRARSAVVAIVLAVPLVLAGCGGSTAPGGGAASSAPATNGLEKLTAEQILAKAKAAAESATSVVVSGSLGAGNTVDLVLGAQGAHAKVTQSGETIEIVKTGTDYYIKGDAAFWTKEASAAAATKFAGKFVKVPATQAAQFADLVTIKAFFEGALKPEGTVAKGDVSAVGSIKAITLKDTKDGGLLYISLVGDPLPLKIEKAGSDGGAVTFTDWNKPVTIDVPPADQVIDLGSLTGG